MSSISRIFRIFSKPYQQDNRRKLSLLALEDRVVPAVTALYNSTSNELIINLQSSNDAAAIVYDSSDGYEINSGAVTILGGYSAADSVDRIIIQDSGDSASGQSVTLTGDTVTLANGLSITGVESVTISAEVGGVAANGISIVGASTKIQLEENLTTEDFPMAFGGPVVLGADITLLTNNSSGGTITFSSTINSVTATPQVAYSLTIDAGTEAVSFGNSLGATKTLNELIIDTTGTVSLAGNITASGNITVDAPLTLARPVTISSTGVIPTAILFKGTIDSDSANTPRSLTVGVANQSGTTEFQNELGGTNPLGAVTVHRTGDITINADISTANAAVSFKGAVVLSDNSVITTQTGSGKGANVLFGSKVDATTAGGQELTVDAGSAGAVSFSAAVGGSTKLGEIDITGKTIALSGNVSTDESDIALTGASVLNASITIASGNGDITLTGSVNGSGISNRTLTLDCGEGDVLLNADIGNLRALSSFTISHCNDATVNKTVKASTVAITSDDNTDNVPSIIIAEAATITGATTLTMSEKNAVIDVSGRFYGTVTVTGESTTKNASTDTTTLKATSNSNFTVTGTDVADRSKGTLVKTQPGKSATFTFSNINALDLTGGSSGNAFTLKEWFYDADIDGLAGSDSIVVNRAQDATSGLEFVLATGNLDINAPGGSFGAGASSPVEIDYTLAGLEAASLSGGPGGDTFDISDWSAKASVIGNAGLDELIWSLNGASNAVLTPTSFTAGSLVASISSINSAELSNTQANSSFTITGFVGGVDITGGASSTVTATYNANFSLDGTSATAGTITTGNTTIDFTSVSNVVLNGGARDNVFTLDGTYLGTVTLDGAAGNDTYNIQMPVNNATKNVTVTDTGKTTRDTIIARSITSTGLLSKNSTQVFYTADGSGTDPRINFTGVEIITLL